MTNYKAQALLTVKRRKTRQIHIGSVAVGGGAPISVQTMTKTDTRDVSSTVAQITELESMGCDIIRVAVVDKDAAAVLADIRSSIRIPMVADIHFDYKLALEAAKHVDKLRIKSGNIGNEERIKKVINAAKDNSLPIRIGVNLGSLEKDIEKKLKNKIDNK